MKVISFRELFSTTRRWRGGGGRSMSQESESVYRVLSSTGRTDGGVRGEKWFVIYLLGT